MPHFDFRRFVTSLVVVVLSSSVVAGCGSSTPSRDEDDTLVVLTTFTVIADMAQNVAGERARVESLTRVGTEIHGYEPTASDVMRASDADLVLHHGMGLEAWFSPFIERVDAPHVTITQDIEPIAIGGTGDGPPNPHAWMSPSNGPLYVRAIERALAQADPEGAATYAANADAYIDQIEDVATQFASSLASIPESQRVLVTCEGAFSYLALDGGLDEVYLWPVNAENEGTAQSVREVIDTVRARDVPAVFCESTVNTSGMEQVAAETGAAFAGVLYVDSLSTDDGPVPTYLDMLSVNARTIADGLGGQSP